MVFRTLAHKTSLHQTQKPSIAPPVSNAVFKPEENGGVMSISELPIIQYIRQSTTLRPILAVPLVP